MAKKRKKKKAKKSREIEKVTSPKEAVSEAKEKVQDARSVLKESKVQMKDIRVQRKEQKQQIREAKKNVKRAKKEVKKATGGQNVVVSAVLYLVFAFALLALFSVFWMRRTWPDLQISEFLFEMTAELGGTASDIIDEFIRMCIIPTVGITLGSMVLIRLTRLKFYNLARVFRRLVISATILCLVIAGSIFYQHLDLGTYVANQVTTSEFIESEYVDPAEVTVTFPETKRNLVYIVLESMEVTYADKENGGAMDRSVIPYLTQLSQENENFSGEQSELNGGHSLYGTTWTMGGLFAQTSGLPLIVDIDGNSMDTQNEFFPGITTIGDILHQNGYRNYFECGSDGSFGGRRLYFTTHGDYEVQDFHWANRTGVIPIGYAVWWGFEDRILIEAAKEQLTQIAASDEPFNYTMLTVDTHKEDGYADAYTKDLFDGDQYSNVIFHSNEQVTEFVSWIQEQPWYENTTVIISGDHPTMDSDYLNDIDPDYDRKVYTTYINAAASPETVTTRTYSTFDAFPTTLAALGCQIEGDRLGLGTNLFSTTETLLERYDKTYVNEQLARKSEFMANLSGVDKTTDSYEVRVLQNGGSVSDVRLLEYKDGNAQFDVSSLIYDDKDIDSVKAYVTHGETKEEYEMESFVDEEEHLSYTVSIPMKEEELYNSAIEFVAHVYSTSAEDYVDRTVYSYEGNLCLIGGDQGHLTDLLQGMQYLSQSRFAILLTTQNNDLSALNKEQIKLLQKIGMSGLGQNTGENVRYAMLSENSKIIHTGVGYIREYGQLADGTPFGIASAYGENSYASVLLGEAYTEYADQMDGLHIIVYDMQEGVVASSNRFKVR